MEVVGRPEVLPLEWQVEGGPPEGQTDLAVGVEVHSQNLQIQESKVQGRSLATGCRLQSSPGNAARDNFYLTTTEKTMALCSYPKETACMAGGRGTTHAVHTR
jgi:hypothetical protein